MKFIAITEVKNADLVKFWNANFSLANRADYKEIKKFSDNETARKRVDALVGYIEYKNDDGDLLDLPEGHMPAPEGYEGFDAPDEWVREEEEAKPTNKPVIASAAAFDMLTKSVQEAQSKAEATGESVMGKRDADTKASNSDGVAASWTDSEVRASRLKRDGVTVECDGQNLGYFKSTYEAFRALRLPNNKCIRFRLKLKTAFRENGEGSVFEHGDKQYLFRIAASE